MDLDTREIAVEIIHTVEIVHEIGHFKRLTVLYSMCDVALKESNPLVNRTIFVQWNTKMVQVYFYLLVFFSTRQRLCCADRGIDAIAFSRCDAQNIVT